MDPLMSVAETAESFHHFICSSFISAEHTATWWRRLGDTTVFWSPLWLGEAIDKTVAKEQW